MSRASKENLQLVIDSIHADHELLMWEEWMKIRKEEIKNLSLRTGRSPVDLIMNQDDKFREIKEQDDVLDNARMKSKPGDVFWELPDRLYQRCCNEGVYEVKKSKAVLRQVEFIEHVQVPNVIQENEKGIVGPSKRPTLTKLNAGYNSFKKIREHELKEDIKKIESHKPDIADLMVLGTAPQDIETRTLENKLARLPVIIIDYCDKVPDPYNDSMEGVYALRINDTIFKTDNTSQESQIFFEQLENQNFCKNSLTWSYYFKVPMKKIGRGKLILQNLGSVRITYCFEKLLNTKNCTALPTYSHDQCKQKFFFKSNEDMVTPGQIKEINFTYFSNTPGIYEEFWNLKILNVDFFKLTHEKIIINLVGETVEDIEKLIKNIQDLKENITTNANYLMIFNILQEAITKAIIKKPEIYPYKDYFLEADLFVTINPDHCYHQTKVQKLKELFTEMTGDEWNLSIKSWRDAVTAKEFDKRMFYYDILKLANRELLKPCTNNLDDLLKQKHRIVALLMNNLIDKFYDERIRLTKAYETDEIIQKSEETFPDGSVAASPAEYINRSNSESSHFSKSSCTPTTFKDDIVLSVFYLHMYEHLVETIETCAGVLSSLDLNRYVDYNMCRCTTSINVQVNNCIPTSTSFETAIVGI